MRDSAEMRHRPACGRWQFEGFTLDLISRTLSDATGKEVPLWRSEFALLATFIEAPGHALSRGQLLEAVSGRRAEAFDRSVDVLVGRLRRKIEADPKAPRLIKTVPGVGYKFAVRPHAPPRWQSIPNQRCRHPSRCCQGARRRNGAT